MCIVMKKGIYGEKCRCQKFQEHWKILKNSWWFTRNYGFSGFSENENVYGEKVSNKSCRAENFDWKWVFTHSLSILIAWISAYISCSATAMDFKFGAWRTYGIGSQDRDVCFVLGLPSLIAFIWKRTGCWFTIRWSVISDESC